MAKYHNVHGVDEDPMELFGLPGESSVGSPLLIPLGEMAQAPDEVYEPVNDAESEEIIETVPIKKIPPVPKLSNKFLWVGGSLLILLILAKKFKGRFEEVE